MSSRPTGETPARPRSASSTPADQFALAREHPTWGLATMSLLVAGLVVGYALLGWLGQAMHERCAAADQAGCDPTALGLVFVSPVLAMVIGLVVSVLGGRILARRERSPMPAAAVGWTVFLVAAGVSGVAGGLA